MWFHLRIKRFKSRWRYLRTYFQTLQNANEIERITDLSRCKQPVLLLYGFGATRRSVSILESRLRKDGFDVFSLKLGGFLDLFNTGPIDTLAQMISEKIEKLYRLYPLPKLCIIGHSKGGLIGRYYVSRLGGDKRVHTLITLATPHRGSPWVLLSMLSLIGLCSRGLRQMIPHSSFLRRLTKTSIPKNVYTVSICSPADKTSPHRFSHLSENGDISKIANVILPNLYHSDFIIKQSAYKEIRKHLTTGFKLAANA